MNVQSPEINKFNHQQGVFLEILATQVAGAIKRLNDLNRIYEQEIQFTRFADNSQDAVCIYYFDMGYTYVNDAMENLLGYSKEYIMSDPDFWTNHAVPEDKHLLLEIAELGKQNKLQPTKLVFKVKDSNDNIIDINGWISPITKNNREIIGFYVTARDITFDKRHENNLRVLNEHAANLATSKSIYEISTTTLNILKSLFQVEFGSFQVVEDDELRTIYTISHPSENSVMKIDGPGVTARVARTRQTIIIGDTNHDPDYLTVIDDIKSELAVPVIVQDKVVAVINIEDTENNHYTDEHRQIVELLAKHVEAAIERIQKERDYLETQQKLIEEHVQLERAKEMDAIKTRFISTAAHELRTPLTSIKGYSEIIGDILDEKNDPKAVEYFQIIKRNLDRLELLTDDLLDLQRIESNKLKLKISDTNIEQLITDVKREMTPLLNAKQQTLIIQLNNQSATVTMDRLRIHQVLVNLISNASKFSPKKAPITLRVDETHSNIKFTIIDQGRGIEPENIEKLFKPFPDIVYADVRRGTGLGLAICKAIIDLHKGTISAESEGKGKGSTFTFTLPK